MFWPPAGPPGLIGPGSTGSIGLRSIGVMVNGEIGSGSGEIGGRILSTVAIILGSGEIGLMAVMGDVIVIGSIGEIGGNGEIPMLPPDRIFFKPRG